MRAPKVVFVGHDASRTGAPLVLLSFLRWLVREVDWAIEVVLLRGGELRADYADVARTVVLDEGMSGSRGLLRRALRSGGYERAGRELQRLWLSRSAGPPPDLVYCNSIAAAPAASLVLREAGLMICHVHELRHAFGSVIATEDLAWLLNRTERYIACADVVRDFLVERHGIPPVAIDVVHEFLLPSRGTRARIERKALGIADSAIVIGAVGTIEWRKGSDLFVQLARRLTCKPTPRPHHFLWVGGGTPEETRQFRYDIEQAGLEQEVSIVGPVDDPGPFYELMDVFVLTSREDPFPLVCLEAAAAGKPIVCFHHAGGAPELVGTDDGSVVSYLDVPAMAERICDLAENESARREAGERLRRRVLDRFTLDIAGPKISSIVEGVLSRGRESRS